MNRTRESKRATTGASVAQPWEPDLPPVPMTAESAELEARYIILESLCDRSAALRPPRNRVESADLDTVAAIVKALAPSRNIGEDMMIERIGARLEALRNPPAWILSSEHERRLVAAAPDLGIAWRLLGIRRVRHNHFELYSAARRVDIITRMTALHALQRFTRSLAGRPKVAPCWEAYREAIGLAGILESFRKEERRLSRQATRDATGQPYRKPSIVPASWRGVPACGVGNDNAQRFDPHRIDPVVGDWLAREAASQRAARAGLGEAARAAR